MMIPDDIVNEILGYITNYPQNYPISRSQYMMINKKTEDKFHNKYPNFKRDIHTSMYHINMCALTEQWEDINIIVSLINMDKYISLSIENLMVKYAIAVFHRFGRFDMAINMMIKYDPDPDISHLIPVQNSYINHQSNSYTNIICELVYIMYALELGNKCTSRMIHYYTNLHPIRNMDMDSIIPTIYQIGNINNESYKFITGKDMEFIPICNTVEKGKTIQIPINTHLDMYSYLLSTVGINEKVIACYLGKRLYFYELCSIFIVTPIILDAISEYLGDNKRIIMNPSNIYNPVIISVLYKYIGQNGFTSKYIPIIRDIIKSHSK